MWCHSSYTIRKLYWDIDAHLVCCLYFSIWFTKYLNYHQIHCSAYQFFHRLIRRFRRQGIQTRLNSSSLSLLSSSIIYKDKTFTLSKYVGGQIIKIWKILTHHLPYFQFFSLEFFIVYTHFNFKITWEISQPATPKIYIFFSANSSDEFKEAQFNFESFYVDVRTLFYKWL